MKNTKCRNNIVEMTQHFLSTEFENDDVENDSKFSSSQTERHEHLNIEIKIMEVFKRDKSDSCAIMQKQKQLLNVFSLECQGDI